MAAHDLERLIGREALATLAQVAGGLDLYIPAKVPMDGPLLDLPLAAQEALARYAGGTRLYIPMLCGELRRIRDAQIRAACDRGETTRKDAAGCILYAAEKATALALEAIQALGGNGYINEFPAGRLMRDAKLYAIGAGTNEIRRMLIGRELFNGHG